MRIAFSCAGEGFGHAAKIVALGPLLESKHELYYFILKTVRYYIRSRLAGRRLRYVPHFSFVKRGDRIHILETIIRSIPQCILFPFHLILIARCLKKWKIQAAISDFDPYLAWASYIARIPVLQINHPGVVQRVSPRGPHARLTALGAKLMEGPWTERIHISFYNGDAGPIIRPELLRLPKQDKGFMLVYLKSTYLMIVLPIIEKLNIPYRLFPNIKENFDEALANCSFVLSSGGHQIAAEALTMGKPMLAIPQKWQWEQQLNAINLKETGRGNFTTTENLSHDLPLFIAQIERYRKAKVPPKFKISDATHQVLSRIESFLLKHK